MEAPPSVETTGGSPRPGVGSGVLAVVTQRAREVARGVSPTRSVPWGGFMLFFLPQLWHPAVGRRPGRAPVGGIPRPAPVRSAARPLSGNALGGGVGGLPGPGCLPGGAPYPPWRCAWFAFLVCPHLLACTVPAVVQDWASLPSGAHSGGAFAGSQRRTAPAGSRTFSPGVWDTPTLGPRKGRHGGASATRYPRPLGPPVCVCLGPGPVGG